MHIRNEHSVQVAGQDKRDTHCQHSKTQYNHPERLVTTERLKTTNFEVLLLPHRHDRPCAEIDRGVNRPGLAVDIYIIGKLDAPHFVLFPHQAWP